MAIFMTSLAQVEHGEYPFENAVATTDVKNGAFGTVTGGTFAVGATATKAVMQLETGDDIGLDTFVIKAGTPLRIVDLTKVNGDVQIYGDTLPATVAENDKLVSKADGTLEVKASASAPYFKVTKVLGNTHGVVAKIVKA